MSEQPSTFENRLRAVHENDTLKEILRILNLASVFVTVYAFLYLSINLLFQDIYLGLRVLCVLAVPFLFISLLRRIIKAPRPMELFSFYGEGVKHKEGRAFPSRHAFSAFAVGTLLCFYHFLFGLLVIILALLMSVARVLLGYHFPRDVIAGGAIGVLCSALGYFLLIL